MPAKKQTRKPYGRRASGKTQTTISLSDETSEKAKKNAEKDGRSLSNYIEQLLKSLPLIILALLAYGFMSRPKAQPAESPPEPVAKQQVNHKTASKPLQQLDASRF